MHSFCKQNAFTCKYYTMYALLLLQKLPLSTYLALGIHSKKWLRAILTSACTIYVMIISAAFMFPVTKTDVNFQI